MSELSDVSSLLPTLRQLYPNHSQTILDVATYAAAQCKARLGEIIKTLPPEAQPAALLIAAELLFNELDSFLNSCADQAGVPFND